LDADECSGYEAVVPSGVAQFDPAAHGFGVDRAEHWRDDERSDPAKGDHRHAQRINRQLVGAPNRSTVAAGIVVRPTRQ
jgi:hypothetical protein